MKTLVIILAQGNQSRLSELPVAKQMLGLIACDDTPIMYRTVRQVEAIEPDSNVMIVTWKDVARTIVGDGFVGRLVWPPRRHLRSILTLSEPGNSSLRGFAHTLDHVRGEIDMYDRVACLLGDVVYSWACLRQIFSSDQVRFVGTADLSNASGELWGFSWSHAARGDIYRALHDAYLSHPKFSAYQPGQMRRLLWALHNCDATPVHPEMRDKHLSQIYRAVDDYTRDIDVPAHLVLLPGLSRAACEDDAKNGVVW